MADELADANIEMDSTDIYREETFTDRKVGTLQRLTPVTSDGERDENRAVIYVGQTQILTPGGALPLSFEVEAGTLQEAIENFGDHAKQALEDTMKRLEEMRREAASSLIVPGSSAAGGTGTLPPGGIQMP